MKETSLVTGRVTAAVVEVAGEGQEDGRAGPEGTAANREWWLSWPELYACQREGPPCPG